MATGFLKFDHDHTVYIDLDLATDEVRKAVIIDGDDVETPICSGGDFTTAKLTIINTGGSLIMVSAPIKIDSGSNSASYGYVSVDANDTVTVDFVMYKGKADISPLQGAVEDMEGNISLIDNQCIATGDCSIVLDSGLE